MTLFKYLISTVIGIAIGAFAYSYYTPSASSEIQPASNIAPEQIAEKSQQSPILSTNSTKLLSPETDYNQLLKEKDLEIETLKAQLAQLRLTNEGNKSEEDQSMVMTKAMSMDDFGKNMVSSMMKDIKNVIIEPSEGELEDLRKSFAEEDTFAEAAIQRTDKIYNYLQSLNENSQFYIDNLACGQKICQLEVSAEDEERWSSSYASLVSQDWFNNMTLKANSDDPNKFIYYLIDTEINTNNMN